MHKASYPAAKIVSEIYVLLRELEGHIKDLASLPDDLDERVAAAEDEIRGVRDILAQRE